MRKYFFIYAEIYFRIMKEKTKCSGEVARMLWSIKELRGADEENELR